MFFVIVEYCTCLANLVVLNLGYFGFVYLVLVLTCYFVVWLSGFIGSLKFGCVSIEMWILTFIVVDYAWVDLRVDFLFGNFDGFEFVLVCWVLWFILMLFVAWGLVVVCIWWLVV